MGDGCSLSGRPGGRHSRGGTHLPSSTASDETTANLAGGAKLAACKRSGAGNGVLGAIVTRCFGLEHCQHSLCAVRRPRRHGPPISLAQRLARIHAMIFSRPRPPSRTEQRPGVDERRSPVGAGGCVGGRDLLAKRAVPPAVVVVLLRVADHDAGLGQ